MSIINPAHLSLGEHMILLEKLLASMKRMRRQIDKDRKSGKDVTVRETEWLSLLDTFHHEASRIRRGSMIRALIYTCSGCMNNRPLDRGIPDKICVTCWTSNAFVGGIARKRGL